MFMVFAPGSRRTTGVEAEECALFSLSGLEASPMRIPRRSKYCKAVS